MKILAFVIVVIAVQLVNSYYDVLRADEKGAEMCKNGFSFDKLFPDRLRYTCKPGPGRPSFVKCTKNLRYNKIPFSCPNFGYYSGWYPAGPWMYYVICCTEKGIRYSYKDCSIVPDDSSKRGEIYQISEGKIIIGSQFSKGRWVRMQCRYDTHFY